ncbi:MAG: hypothetical protein IT359_18920 [Gemmatimonadaceae bacterium]|nr:hypothetical protein [Gemmatimonadaceae bacterium]
MLAALTLVIAFQEVSVRIGTPSEKARADSIKQQAIRDSIRYSAMERRLDREKRPVRRIAVTPELENSAFLDPLARQLLLRARDARMRLDSTLLSYDATSYQRMSVGMGFRAVGRDRLLFRTENVSRVRWSRKGGVFVDLKGARSVFPMAEKEAGEVDMDEISPIPYYPGRDALWIGGSEARAEVDERELVHPLAIGAEAYYRYATGDSLTITLPDGRAIRLRELRIEPRRPEWKLSVGSFWFDVESGQLVRAAYRLAVPIDIWGVVDEELKREKEEAKRTGDTPDEEDAPPGWVKGMLSPMQAQLEAVTIDYGLYGGRFWLPRAQYAEGWARASFMRIPFKMEEGFKYASVNGTDSMPSVPEMMTRRQLRDSLFGDSLPWGQLTPEQRKFRIGKLVEADSVRRMRLAEKRKDDCASTGFYTRVDTRGESNLATAVRLPCDSTVLANSKDLPGSIYEPGEQLFGLTERDALLKELDFSLQPVWAPMPIRLNYGLGWTRYNRVEGLSIGAQATEQLGRGFSWDATARLGVADLVPNVELGVARSNGRATWRVAGYHKLAVANDDWGAPLSFGASLGALFYGRDEGYYYRATGLQLTNGLNRGGALTTRLFVERQGDVANETRFNLSRALGGGSEFLPNITATDATVAGFALRDQRSAGLDPQGWRLLTDARLEGGWTSFDSATSSVSRAYGRVAGEATLSKGFGERLAASLTAGGGVSRNAPLPQRAFYLGGAQTVRGQLLGTAAGEAFWLARGELALSTRVVRPVLFGDLGWAGRRDDWQHPGRPISGAGVGWSVLDGLVRMDLSRGIYPRQRMRLDLYVEARF